MIVLKGQGISPTIYFLTNSVNQLFDELRRHHLPIISFESELFIAKCKNNNLCG